MTCWFRNIAYSAICDDSNVYENGDDCKAENEIRHHPATPKKCLLFWGENF